MKEKLHRLIDACRDKENEVFVPHVDDSEPSEPGVWTAKDVVAHMMSWRQVAAGEIHAVLTGGTPPEVSSDDDEQNEKFYVLTHQMPATTIIKSAAESWDALQAALDECGEEDLDRPRAIYPNQQLLKSVADNTYPHMAEHLGYWYSDQGNEPEAEKSAMWGYDLACSTLGDDPNRRGAAEYNLGCFYAKRGRAADAIPRFARAFELRPDLRALAKSDRDLDPIRSNEDLARLL